MSNFAKYSTFYSLLSNLYLIAHNLQDDPMYERQDAVNDLLEVIKSIEATKPIFKKEGD